MGTGKEVLVLWGHERHGRCIPGKATSAQTSAPALTPVHVAPMDHTTKSASLIPSVQAFQHRQLPQYQRHLHHWIFSARQISLCLDTPDSPLFGTWAPVLSCLSALDLITSPCHSLPFSSSESESEQEDLGSHHSSYPLYGTQFYPGHHAYRLSDPQFPWFGQPWY